MNMHIKVALLESERDSWCGEKRNQIQCTHESGITQAGIALILRRTNGIGPQSMPKMLLSSPLCFISQATRS